MTNHLTPRMRHELQLAIVCYGNARGILDSDPTPSAYDAVLEKWRIVEEQINIIFAECSLIEGDEIDHG